MRIFQVKNVNAAGAQLIGACLTDGIIFVVSIR